MSLEKVYTYDEVITSLTQKKRQKHLLLGNGFSMSYDSGIFSYNALSKFLENLDNDILQKLFQIIKTSNFELLMEQLDNVAQIAEVFGADEKVIRKIRKATESLKESLIEAIKELHPEHVFSVPEEKSKACAAFLNSFLAEEGQIFTTNYDLLLYWVLMRNEIENAIDGFGRDAEESDEWIPEDERQYSELRWGKHKSIQTVHYLHGALQLFDTGVEVIKEEYTSAHFLLDNIKARMEKKEYPIFVTAGNGFEKLSHIVHNKYLANCYENLSLIGGSLICYGFGFGNYDEHIIAAINKAAKKRKDENGNWLPFLNSIYIGVYSDADLKHIKSIEKKFKAHVRVFDAKTVNVWG
jgi:predicted house-cleaning noncanonical NTP pyrophosphatase (MazG superfamily)